MQKHGGGEVNGITLLVRKYKKNIKKETNDHYMHKEVHTAEWTHTYILIKSHFSCVHSHYNNNNNNNNNNNYYLKYKKVIIITTIIFDGDDGVVMVMMIMMCADWEEGRQSGCFTL